MILGPVNEFSRLESMFQIVVDQAREFVRRSHLGTQASFRTVWQYVA
jgi:hypothetical protein